MTLALLMTMDLMDADRPRGEGIESLAPISIQDQIRMSTTPAAAYALRAFYFYQFAEETPAPSVSEYLSLFETASNVSAFDCILGGLALAIGERTRDPEEIASAWHPVRPSRESSDPREKKVLNAYEALRMKPLTEIRSLIKKREGQRPVRDWNLIALSQAPLCDLGERGAFVLNHTALGRSLFDTVRHEILTAAIQKRLPSPHDNEQAIGRLYGGIFESYVLSLLELAYPGRVYRIPEAVNEKRADLLIWFEGSVVIVEIKAVHFVGLNHASFMSIADRLEELRRIGLPNAIKQLAETISALRDFRICPPSMPSYDWTITPIVPLIVTEEQMPWVLGCWEAIYGPLCTPLDDLPKRGPLGKLRLLKIDDVERLPDCHLPYDFATMLRRWGDHRGLTECTWSHFTNALGATVPGELLPRRLLQMVRSLAQTIGLDPSKIGVSLTDSEPG